MLFISTLIKLELVPLFSSSSETLPTVWFVTVSLINIITSSLTTTSSPIKEKLLVTTLTFSSMFCDGSIVAFVLSISKLSALGFTLNKYSLVKSLIKRQLLMVTSPFEETKVSPKFWFVSFINGVNS